MLAALKSFGLLTQGRDSKSLGQALFHVFRRPVQKGAHAAILSCLRRA
jgi:hypothetical protein